MKKFWPRRRRPNPTPPPVAPDADADAEQARYDAAWADYVEWSGLDEEGLPGEPPRSEG